MAESAADSGAAADVRKVSKLTFMPTTTPDAIIVKSFSASSPAAVLTPQPPFPRLHPTVTQERAKHYLAQQEEDRKRKPPPIVALPTPTTPWYPEQPKVPVLGKPLTPNLPTSLSSPRSQQRCVARQSVCAEVLSRFGNSLPPNVSLFYSCFCAEMNEKGNLTAVAFTNVFRDVASIVDITHVDSLFQLIDVRRQGAVSVLHVMTALDVIFNGPESDAVMRACFEPFNMEGRGYIHKAHLDQLKVAKDPLERDAMRTPEMVKILTDLFLDIAKEEEELYIASLSKGKKKAKKKAPPLKANQKSVIPIGRARVLHMNFATFQNYFRTSKTIAITFSRCWLPLVDENTTIRLHIIQRIQDLFSD